MSSTLSLILAVVLIASRNNDFYHSRGYYFSDYSDCISFIGYSYIIRAIPAPLVQQQYL